MGSYNKKKKFRGIRVDELVLTVQYACFSVNAEVHMVQI